MGKKTKTAGKARLDKYYHLAKQHGYRARSAFKLIQLNRKYDFLGSCRAVIDLCAAPGGWLQVAAKCMPVSSLIIGVDLVPIRPIPNCQTFVADITTSACRSTLRKAVQHWKVDAVIHDGAPNVGGNWSKDAFGQAELALHSLKLAIEFLRKGGIFVTKVFRSQDSNSLLWVARQLFDRVEATKPAASRNTSAEIFFMCTGFKAPDKIDPRLLSPEHVFKSVANPEQVPNIMKQSAKNTKRNRTGYEEGQLILQHTMTATEFINAEVANTVLAKNNVIVFSEACAHFRNHSSTTDEIVALCTDLKVLGRRDFKMLLKWRRALIAYRDELTRIENGDDDDEVESEPVAETAEQKEVRENQELQDAVKRIESRKKKEARVRRLQKVKARVRQMGMINLEEGVGDAPEESMFSMNLIENSKELELVREAEDSDDGEPLRESDEESEPQYATEDEIDEATQEAQLECDLEAAYNEYKQARGIQDRVDLRAKKKVAIGFPESEGEDSALDIECEQNLDTSNNALLAESVSSACQKNADADTTTTNRWFEREMFTHMDNMVSKKDVEQRNRDAVSSSDDEDGNEAMDSVVDDSKELVNDSDEQEEPSMGGPLLPGSRAAREMAQATGFEEIAAEESDAWTSDSEGEAEMLAIGRLFLKKSKRQEIEDNSYNRYAFQDPKNLPRWFTYEESMHNKPSLPVSKADVNEEKSRLAAINARPIAKIAEARARKKFKAAQRWEKIKTMADHIQGQEHLPAQEKFKQLDSLYKKKGKTTVKKEKQYVVTRKSGAKVKAHGGAKKNARVKMVDKRMKADRRGRDASDRKRKKAGAKRMMRK